MIIRQQYDYIEHVYFVLNNVFWSTVKEYKIVAVQQIKQNKQIYTALHLTGPVSPTLFG